MASLDEPYLVTSYGISADRSRSASDNDNERFKLGVTSVVYRESSKASKTGKQQSRRPIAVNTVQGNGIHLVDLSDQSPLSAFTVSPTTIFTCKAISISSEARRDAALTLLAKQSAASTSLAAGSSSSSSSTFKGRSRKTFVGLEQNGEYQICCWTEVEDADGTAIGDAVKVTKTVTSPIIAVASLGNTFFTFDVNGGVAHYDAELKELSAQSLEFKNSQIRRIQILQSGHLFDSEGLPVSQGALPVYRVSALVFETNPVDKRSSPKKSSKKRQSDVGQPASEDLPQKQRGHIVYLTVSGQSIVETGRALLPVEGIIDCVQLREGKFATIDAIGSLKTFLLDRTALVYVRPSDPLAIKGVSLPFLSTSEQSLQLKTDLLQIRHARLSPVSPTQATLSPSHCLVLAVPRSDRPGTVDVSLWDTSLGLALAHREIALPTLLEREGLNSISIVPLPSGLVGLAYTPTPDVAGLDTQAQLSKRSTLHAMSCVAPAQMNLASVVGKRALTQQYVQELSTSVSTNTKAATSNGTQEEDLIQALEKLLGADAPKRDVTAAEEAFNTWLSSLEGEKAGKLKKKMTHLSSRQARRMIQLAVPAKLDEAVASNIVQSLLVGKTISDSSIDGGLTSNLLQRRNWDLVRASLRSCDDIPESTLVSILAVYLGPDARKSKLRYPLDKWIRLIVQVPTSPSILRSCLKKQLSSDDVKAILQVMDHWLALEGKQVALDGTVKSSSPGTAHIIPFLQALLDAHLVTILQSVTLHPLVQSVSAHLLDTISLSASIQNLQGPLEAFSKAHEQEKERQAALKKASSKKAQYQDKAWNAKKVLQENQLLLGDYAIETFQL